MGARTEERENGRRRRLFSPFPEDFPGGDQFLREAGGGEFEEAAAVGEVFVFVADDVRAEEIEAALELFELGAGENVVEERIGSAGHGGNPSIVSL